MEKLNFKLNVSDHFKQGRCERVRTGGGGGEGRIAEEK